MGNENYAFTHLQEVSMSGTIDFFKELIDKVVDITSMQCLWVLAVATGIIFLICYIRVLIKMFSSKGIVIGILGIVFVVYAFIWGWVNHEEYGIKNVMTNWSVAIGVGASLYILTLLSF